MPEPARILADALDEDVRAALAICGGDAIEALRVALIANAFLEAEVGQLKKEVSSGYSRGRVRKAAPTKKGAVACR
jgi:hypothetical protein